MIMPRLRLNFKTYNIAEPCPSSVFQNHLREYLESDSEAASKLIDTMLNQLNWAFSEFVRILQEVVTTFCALMNLSVY